MVMLQHGRTVAGDRDSAWGKVCVGWKSGCHHGGLPLKFGPFPLCSILTSAAVLVLATSNLFYFRDTTLGLYGAPLHSPGVANLRSDPVCSSLQQLSPPFDLDCWMPGRAP
jgi:hypothetical protein